MLSKISDETFDGGGTFDDFRSDLEIALSTTRLAARSDHERVGTVNIMVLLNQSDSTTLEQGMQQEMSKETRQAERKDSRQQNPRADAEWWHRSNCGTTSRKRQVLGVSQKSAISNKRLPATKGGSFEKDRQAAEEESEQRCTGGLDHWKHESSGQTAPEQHLRLTGQQE